MAYATQDAQPLIITDQNPEHLFYLSELLGEGSYGKVYKATCITNGFSYAIKIVNAQWSEMENLKKEIRILADCTSPHVVQYYGSYFFNEQLWVVMEYCEVGSIADLLKAIPQQASLTELHIAALLKGMLHALTYLHAHKKIHRDIKAANVLLNKKGQVKLADFGVSAQLVHTQGYIESFIGTPFWMSPEVLSQAKYNSKTDIWGLGVTAIEMAEGEPPFSKLSQFRAIMEITRNPPRGLATPSRWTPNFNKFVERCLTIDQDSRPSSEDLLNDPFIVSMSEESAAHLLKSFAENCLPHIQSYRKKLLDRITSRKQAAAAAAVVPATPATQAFVAPEVDQPKFEQTSQEYQQNPSQNAEDYFVSDSGTVIEYRNNQAHLSNNLNGANNTQFYNDQPSEGDVLYESEPGIDSGTMICKEVSETSSQQQSNQNNNANQNGKSGVMDFVMFARQIEEKERAKRTTPSFNPNEQYNLISNDIPSNPTPTIPIKEQHIENYPKNYSTNSSSNKAPLFSTPLAQQKQQVHQQQTQQQQLQQQYQQQIQLQQLQQQQQEEQEQQQQIQQQQQQQYLLQLQQQQQQQQQKEQQQQQQLLQQQQQQQQQQQLQQQQQQQQQQNQQQQQQQQQQRQAQQQQQQQQQLLQYNQHELISTLPVSNSVDDNKREEINQIEDQISKLESEMAHRIELVKREFLPRIAELQHLRFQLLLPNSSSPKKHHFNAYNNEQTQNQQQHRSVSPPLLNPEQEHPPQFLQQNLLLLPQTHRQQVPSIQPSTSTHQTTTITGQNSAKAIQNSSQKSNQPQLFSQRIPTICFNPEVAAVFADLPLPATPTQQNNNNTPSKFNLHLSNQNLSINTNEQNLQAHSEILSDISQRIALKNNQSLSKQPSTSTSKFPISHQENLMHKQQQHQNRPQFEYLQQLQQENLLVQQQYLQQKKQQNLLFPQKPPTKPSPITLNFADEISSQKQQIQQQPQTRRNNPLSTSYDENHMIIPSHQSNNNNNNHTNNNGQLLNSSNRVSTNFTTGPASPSLLSQNSSVNNNRELPRPDAFNFVQQSLSSSSNSSNNLKNSQSNCYVSTNKLQNRSQPSQNYYLTPHAGNNLPSSSRSQTPLAQWISPKTLSKSSQEIRSSSNFADRTKLNTSSNSNISDSSFAMQSSRLRMDSHSSSNSISTLNKSSSFHCAKPQVQAESYQRTSQTRIPQHQQLYSQQTSNQQYQFLLTNSRLLTNQSHR